MFLAVIPPADVISAISDLPTRALRGVRYTRREQWHFTIRFLGDTEVADALTALAELNSPPAEVTLGPKVELLGTRIVMIPASGLEELASATQAAFEGVGEPQEPRDFSGHITIARLKGAPLRDPSVVSVIGEPVATSFTASSIVLIKAELEPDGAVHTIVAEKSLDG